MSSANGSDSKALFRRLLFAFLPLAVLIAIPLILRPNPEGKDISAKERLIIISPHAEPIKYEFEHAFRKYYLEKFGKDIVFDWRSPGGTSDIVRYINDRYEAAFRQHWESNPENGSWNKTIAGAFSNQRLDRTPPDAPPEAVKARKTFLSSNVGIGIDLFFGGGAYDHAKHADKGYAVDAGIRELHPDWFTDDIIPREFSGETLYDNKGRYYGVCLASFGICYNTDRIKSMSDSSPPVAWHDLGEPRFFQQIAVADPTKSGSINKCFEMIIQESMAEAVEKDKLNGKTAGWADGLNLIKRIAANSRYITDSAGKVPQDVANGNTAAGMCIDFYGRSEAEWTELQSGVARVLYVSPRNGTSVSPDPIQLLRGSQNPQAARAFIEFVLSKEGQKLWNFRLETPGGPLKYALRRTPIRKDMFVPEYQRFMSDKDYDPYSASEGFKYHAEWTAPYFNLIRTMIKCIALDPQPELSKAWQDIIKAGGPEAVPQAMAELSKLPFSYADAAKNAALLSTNRDWTMLDVIRLRREWTEQSRLNYLKASELAEDGK
ncbi:MAG: ABC transporter substrate-binding protein [Victivallales bacterium]|jgi:ABC-type Fe3+ transport system substrate-binding protein